MILVNARSLRGSLGLLSLGLVVAISGLVSNTALFVLVGLSLLATVALLGARASIIMWPIGLMANLLLSYVRYLWSWASNSDGISATDASTCFITATVIFASFAFARIISAHFRRDSSTPVMNVNPLASIFLVSVPAFLVVLVIMRTGSNPARLISGHLAGGDHGLHNQLIHRLIDPSDGSELTSPFSMYAYPRAVHFLVGLMNMFDGTVRKLPTVASEYVTAAQFEYLQLAAMVQCSLVIVAGRALNVRRALCAIAAVVFVMSIDNYVAHAFWSGFTTSLSVTWLLLLAIAVSRSGRLPERKSFRLGLWMALSIACWITYQPFAIVGVVMLAGEIGGGIGVQATENQTRSVFGRAMSGFWMPILLPVILSFLPRILEGSASPAVTSLLLDGSLYRPYFWTVVFLLIAAVGGVYLMTEVQDFDYLWVVLGVAGLAIGSACVVITAGGPGLMNQPYYVQKIFWVLVYLCVPLVVGHILDASFALAETRGWDRDAAMLTVVSAAILLPIATGHTPAAATRHFNVDWFAKSLLSDQGKDARRSIAFSMQDKLGNHLANLALLGTSTIRLPVEVSLSGNPYLACKYLRATDVRVVYTTSNGQAELIESGCPEGATYVEEGLRKVLTRPDFFGVRGDVTETFTDSSLGFRLLLRGFLPPEKWGIWAGGYSSALGLKYEQAMKSPALELLLRSYPEDEEMREVSVGVNGVTATTHRLEFGKPTLITAHLPAGAAGTSIEVTISCSRTDKEILADNPVDGPTPCAGLISMRLVERSD